MKPAGKRRAGTANGCPTLPSRKIYHFIDSLKAALIGRPFPNRDPNGDMR